MATTILLTDELRAEYERLYAEADTPPDRQPAVARAVQEIVANWPRYETVAATVGCPPHLVALIHSMESGCNFSRHLHNGDPLTARTVHVPAGRPASGEPPYTWEASAIDALRYHNIDAWDDWSVAGLCYVLEGYNGWGYRKYHKNVKSPYLWSFTSIYTSGKYVADGKWSESAVSQQIGAVALLMEIVRQGHPFPAEGGGDAPTNPVPAPTPIQPAAPVLPPDRLPDVPGDGTTMGDAVRAVGVPEAGAVVPLLVALSKSKTAWGIVGMFGMQLLGLATWDVAIRVGQQIYTVPDLLPVFSSLFAGLGIWGRITAKPIGAKTNV